MSSLCLNPNLTQRGGRAIVSAISIFAEWRNGFNLEIIYVGSEVATVSCVQLPKTSPIHAIVEGGFAGARRVILAVTRVFGWGEQGI